MKTRLSWLYGSSRLKDSFIFAGVKEQLEYSRIVFQRQNDKEQFVCFTWLSSICILLASVMFFSQGYYAGFHSVNSLAEWLPDDLWQMTTFLGDTTMCLCLMLFFARRNPSLLVIILIAAVYGTFLCHGMKAYFAMPRPPAVLNQDDYVQIGQAFRRNSFPSGHSLSIFILVSSLFYFAKQTTTRITLLTFGCWVALSRVMVGAHWPIDVLVGSAIGVMVTATAIYTAKRWRGGFSTGIHFFVVSLLVISAIMLYSHNGGYPRATLFGGLVATVALAFFISEYLFVPYAQRNVRRRSVSSNAN